jgi:uncharacterized protein YkwD
VLVLLLLACLAPVPVAIATNLAGSSGRDSIETASGAARGRLGADGVATGWPSQSGPEAWADPDGRPDGAGAAEATRQETTSSTASPTTTAPGTTTPAPPTTARLPATSSPTTVRATTTPWPPPPSLGEQVVALANEARADAGCGPLRIDDRLVAAAQAHSDDMAEQDYFSHDSLDGRTFVDRVLAAGYPEPGGENIARGQDSAESVHEAWMASSGHRANILECDFVAIGVGVETSTWTWTQDFGG